MAVLPSPTVVAGQNYAIYEAWYRHVDPKNLGSIGALDAANFLKKSGLSTAVLGKIWDLSDPQGKGYLDKNGFFTALKLVSLAQNGIEINMVNIGKEMIPPDMGEQPPTLATTATAIPTATSLSSIGALSPTGSEPKTYDWTVSSTDKTKYDALFDQLKPINGKLPGVKVKEVLMNSGLPLDVLGKIWDLSDMDRDGQLDRNEFTAAMHLVYKVLDNYPLPPILPRELLQSFGETAVRRASGLGIEVAVPQPIMSPPESQKLDVSSNGHTIPWVVNEADKVKYHALFVQADMDRDGYVSGNEIKGVFLQSRLPQPVLAGIWALCDIGQTGKLNSEQFALAMWLIQQKIQGKDLPSVLSPEMVPPSLRPKEGSAEDLTHSAELDQISKDIDNLNRERRQLETDITQKEADIRIKTGELKNLQSEYDTLTATLKQLEVQKREAQKRLDDLDKQRGDLEQDLEGVERQIEEHEKQVNTFRAQAEEQENNLKAQEAEVAAKKQELADLRNEELRMEQQLQSTTEKLEKLVNTLQDTQLQISQVKARITVLQEHQHQLDEALTAYEEALESGDPTTLSDSVLRPITSVVSSADFVSSPTSEKSKVNGATSSSGDGGFGSDPFSSLNGKNGGFAGSNGDPFKDSDFFGKSSQSATANDPFGSKDPFVSAFGSASKPANDPFASAFGPVKSEPFNAFSNTAGNANTDPFGSDPFNAPKSPEPGRVESPTPALPPKKSKQPPPRPAPPKTAGGKPPARPAPPVAAASKSPDPFAPLNDPFAAPNPAKDPFEGAEFADFSSFDTKFTASSSGEAFDAWGTSVSTSSTNTASVSQQHRYAELEFTEDPFKDVAFGDPFASHTDDPFAVPASNATITSNGMKKKGSDSFDPFSPDKDPFAPFASTEKITTDFTDSPFSSAAWNVDPFAAAAAANNNNKSSSVWGDDLKFPSPPNNNTKSALSVTPNTLNKSRSPSSYSSIKIRGSDSLPKFSEEAQLAWVAADSVRLEEERRMKAELQEKQDLEMAIALSRSEMDARSAPPADRLI